MLATKPATYADLEKVPPHLVAEIIHGVLYTRQHGLLRTAMLRSALAFELSSRIKHDYHSMYLPEVHVGADVVVPEWAAWRHGRLGSPLSDDWREIAAPDWVGLIADDKCKTDLSARLAIYARAGVAFLWLLDPDEQVLEAFRLEGENWLLVGTATGAENVCLPPFDAVSFPLPVLFPFDPPKGGEPPQG